MVDMKDIPYGALYSFQPDYLGYLIQDEFVHEDEGLEVSTTTEVTINTMKDFLAKSG